MKSLHKLTIDYSLKNLQRFYRNPNSGQHPMRVCICNGIKEEAIRAALESGAAKVADIYRHSECAPSCGQCVPLIREILNNHAPLQFSSD